MSALNALRRQLVEKLDDARAAARRKKVEAALGSIGEAPRTAEVSPGDSHKAGRTLKVRVGQKVPDGDWREVVVAVGLGDFAEEEARLSEIEPRSGLRLALPVYTAEPDFNRLRSFVKRLVRAGHLKWEASDLATLRLLKSLDISDVTADWTLAAFNSLALAALSEEGVRGFVASPENVRQNMQALAESGYGVEFLAQQSTPLFISLTKPEAEPGDLGGNLTFFRRGGLWVTTRESPRTFDVPAGSPSRIDLSWDPHD